MTKIKFDSEREIRDTLLQYGVDYFRHKAGYIAPQVPLDAFGDIPCIWGLRKAYLVDFGYKCAVVHYEPHYSDKIIGEIDYLWGKAALCYECAHKYNRALDSDILYVTCWIADEYCIVCGRYEDGIPF